MDFNELLQQIRTTLEEEIDQINNPSQPEPIDKHLVDELANRSELDEPLTDPCGFDAYTPKTLLQTLAEVNARLKPLDVIYKQGKWKKEHILKMSYDEAQALRKTIMTRWKVYNERKRLNMIKQRPKYQNNALIYKIVCNDPEIQDLYVGSTIDYEERQKSHKISCNDPNSKEYHKYKYEYIRANGGFDNWHFEIIEHFSCDNRTELEYQEFKYIDGNCLNEITVKLTPEEKEERRIMWQNSKKDRWY